MFDSADIQKNKTMAALAYIIFFLPLIACPDSKFGKYHANQALLLFFLNIIACILVIIPIVGWILAPIIWVVWCVFTIMGIISASKGEAKPLPLIGGISIIK
ncbi:MAG: DUF4870 domain-containing protein [Eubacteriales bacterium]|nr:DUF4870 domain-containing protein [Eubacteriales bacterium]